MSHEHQNPQYRCPICDSEMSLTNARIAVICTGHHKETGFVDVDLSVAGNEDITSIRQICEYIWGETEVVCFNKEYDILKCSNILVKKGKELVGMISLAIEEEIGMIVLFNVYPKFQGLGIGKKLLDRAYEWFHHHRVSEVRVATSNDDLPALYVYQRSGFQIYEIVPGVIQAHHGDLISGFAGLPVRDELRLRKLLF